MPEGSVAEEAERTLRICAACMYCDGLCPVFPALSGKHGFSSADIAYLANLCHNCRACWYACQYAPPHPFAVNVPAALAAARRQSYADAVWPRFLEAAFQRPALGALIMVGAALAAMLVLLAAVSPAALSVAHVGPGSFYAITPWGLLAVLAGLAFGAAIVSVAVSTGRLWRAIAPPVSLRGLRRAVPTALRDIVTLRHLGGGGPGCNDADIRFSGRRRIFHHLMAGGVVLDFGATAAATIEQDLFGRLPPYPLVSAPVISGTLGGLAIVAGTAGLLLLEARAERAPAERGETVLNMVFLVALAMVAVTGLALLALRESPAMGPLLIVHVGLVVGLIAALPAAKSLHAPFRAAALLRAAAEGRRGRAPASSD